MTVAIISAGYDGTVDEVQFAEILHRYSVVGVEDFRATTQAGDRIVAISDGTALGPGTRDVATGLPAIQFAAASGTRWDLVALRRDWQPPGGSSSIAIIQGGATKAFPAIGTAAANWNRRPGIIDDQPLYLQEVNGTLLGQRVDLRCWASHGGLFANDDLVRSYLERVGTEVNINGAVWSCTLGANETIAWTKLFETGKTPLFGFGSAILGAPEAAQPGFLMQSGTAVATSDGAGYARLAWPNPFPNGLLSVHLSSGDDWAGGPLFLTPAGSPTINGTPNFYGSAGAGNKTEVVYAVRNLSGLATNKPHRINYTVIGW